MSSVGHQGPLRRQPATFGRWLLVSSLSCPVSLIAAVGSLCVCCTDFLIDWPISPFYVFRDTVPVICCADWEVNPHIQPGRRLHYFHETCCLSCPHLCPGRRCELLGRSCGELFPNVCSFFIYKYKQKCSASENGWKLSRFCWQPLEVLLKAIRQLLKNARKTAGKCPNVIE
jgi:hypothetical protein